jgi:hypothetical protein
MMNHDKETNAYPLSELTKLAVIKISAETWMKEGKESEKDPRIFGNCHLPKEIRDR